MDKNLTVIMPFLNEKREPLKTIESICNTADISRLEIIAIDDCSKDKVDFPSMDNLRVIRNDKRIGVDAARQLGVNEASNDMILIIDAHMRFKDGWLPEMMKCIEKAPETLWCCICLGLGYGGTMLKPKGRYYGADMVFVNEEAVEDRPGRECLEPKWADEAYGVNEYAIPCILGANYFFSKRWFQYIGGLKGLKSWGSSEPFLSIKSYMAGGDCRVSKNIEIGHLFRSDAPYRTNVCDLVYNKIYLCKTLFPPMLEEKMLSYMDHDKSFNKATRMIERDSEHIASERAYYDGIWINSISDYCSRFNIRLP